MTRYMCLVSGEVFDEEIKAAEHANNKHNISLDDAIHTNGIFVTLSEDQDPEKVYNEQVERRKD